MQRFGSMFFLPFAVLAHIEQDGFRILREPGARLLDRNFVDLWSDFVDQFEKSR